MLALFFWQADANRWKNLGFRGLLHQEQTGLRRSDDDLIEGEAIDRRVIEFPLPFGNFWLIIGMSMATACRSATAGDLSGPVRMRRIIASALLREET